MANDLAYYLKEGAELLGPAGFGFATDPDLDHGSWRKSVWRKIGRSKYGADILAPRTATEPGTAVARIFIHPARWTFDCSEFVQVVNMFAWLKVLGPTVFNDRAIQSGGIKIQPFIGSTFTARQHYYRRETRGAFMRYWPNGDSTKEQQTCMKAWDVFAAAPVGSRVNFTNDRGVGAWRFENTIKYSWHEVLAFPLDPSPLKINDFILKLYRRATNSQASLAEAEMHIWIKEIEFFVDVPQPVSCN
jgi:hypothetical protein